MDNLLTEVSLWSADMTRFREEIQRIDNFTDGYHFDVGDAHFSSQLLFFPDLVASLRPLTSKPFHVHLMVENPLKLIEDFARAGANRITVHCEQESYVTLGIKKVRQQGLNCGLALGLGAPLESVLPYLSQIDMILMMGTQIGVKGQDLAPQACDRIRKMRTLLEENGCQSTISIEADGGIRTNTVPELYASGADYIVPGSLVFKSEDLSETFTWLKSLKRKK